MFQRQPTQSRTRSGFTLVELMVVILIISILSALLTVAVSRGITVAKRTRNMTELRQLDSAITAFLSDNKVNYIPSYLVLSSKQASYTGSSSQLYQESYAYLLRLWPRLFANGNVNWSGVANAPDQILFGDQCLVFFLGGIPFVDSTTGNVNCTGFAKSPADPAAHLTNSSVGVSGPYFEFNASRLVKLHKSSPFFLSYLDTYGVGDGKGNWVSGMPYAYFSSYGIRNGYNHFGIPECTWSANDVPQGFPTSQILPYAQSAKQYLNPSTCQIISAGTDSLFGPGTANPTLSTGGPFWTPATAASSAASGTQGADDQSNFYDNLLGVPSIN